MMSRLPHAQRIVESILLTFVAVAILWRGGKSVDATWMLALVAILVTTTAVWYPLLRYVDFPAQPSKNQSSTPLSLWAAVLFFIAWSVASYLTSSTKTYGLDEVMRDASCGLLFLWIVRRSSVGKQCILPSQFPLAIVGSGIVATLFGVVVYVFQPVNRFVGSFLDWRFHTDYWPNAWAQFLLLAWPMAALLVARQTTPVRRRASIIAVGVLVGALFLSYSRGGTIAFVGQLFCGMAMLGALALRDVRVSKIVKAHWKTYVRYCVGACCVALIVFTGVNAVRSARYDVQSVTEKIAFKAAEGTSSIDERSQFWSQAVTLSFERPLFGYGPYSFRFSQPHLMQSVLATSDHPHNVFLKLAAERGWPAVAGFLAIIVLVVAWTARSLFFERKNDWSVTNDAFTVAMLLSVLGVLAHNLIDYNMQFVGIALPLWICLGLLSVNFPVQRPESRASFSRWKLMRSFARVEHVIIVLLFATTAWEGVFLVTSSLGRHAEAMGDASAALTWYDRSRFEFFSRDLHLAQARLLAAHDLDAEADAAIEASLAQNPLDARAWRIRSELALEAQDYTLAYRYASHAYELARYTDIGILRTILDAGLNAGEREVLRDRKLEFDALFGAYADAILHNTHYIALGGNVEELEAVSVQLARLFPTDAQRYRDIASEAAAHADAERAISSARPVGLLW